ncbi:MAG: leucine-rich repeat domain-containing protein [Candidatus Hodarchaeota archaeon]
MEKVTIICSRCKNRFKWSEPYKFCPKCGCRIKKKMEYLKDGSEFLKCYRCKTIAPKIAWDFYLGCPACIRRRNLSNEFKIPESVPSNDDADEYVVLFGEEIDVIDGSLDLSHKGIKEIESVMGLRDLYMLRELDLSGNRIEDITGLLRLTNLRRLVLRSNKIREIKNLRTLVYLQHLDLRNNRIEMVKGLEYFFNLRELGLGGNLIGENFFEQSAGGLDAGGFVKYPQEIVENLFQCAPKFSGLDLFNVAWCIFLGSIDWDFSF